MKAPIRTIIADDHALFRQGLRLLLELEPEIEVVAEVHRAADLEATVKKVPSDVLLLDLQMERWSLADIEPLSALVRIVVVTASERTEDGLAAIRLGARAVVQKRFASETLMDAIRAAAQDLVWLPPELQRELAKQWRAPEAKTLTGRERDIVRLVGLGLRNPEIAKRLFISEVTVKTHLNNVFHKLALRDRVDLARYAIRMGLAGVHEQDR
ncbi:MAG: response regulator transcription factor [Deltaproteobacteria bacterium]|nr:response regulator transcription factor [Deltaproteobacteria bacterium]